MKPSPIERYRQFVESQPAINDEWFVPCLDKFQQGDLAAEREISGAYLRVALSVAEKFATGGDEGDLLTLAQEANAALLDAIAAFPHGNSADFAVFAEDYIRRSLKELC